VVGRVLCEEAPGTVSLHRFSKENEWRVARAGRADLLAAGFKDDGQLGYAQDKGLTCTSRSPAAWLVVDGGAGTCGVLVPDAVNGL
jgi:hypothetical protein